MLSIRNNIMAANAVRHLGNSYRNLAESVERLSSGLRINGARDDAAGLAVRQLMRADIAVLKQASRNAQDGISMLQTMEGAMATVDEALMRMKELAEQAATGTYSDEQRRIMNHEFNAMMAEVNRISTSTRFNDIAMLNSDSGAVSIHVGSDQTIDLDKVDIGFGADTQTTTTTDHGAMSNPANGVASPANTWLTIKENSANQIRLDIQFTSSSGPDDPFVSVVLDSSAAGRQYSLSELVTAINTWAGYQLAEVAYDDGTATYNLRLLSQGSGMDGLTVNIWALATAGDWVSGGFTATGPGTTDVSGQMQPVGDFQRSSETTVSYDMNILHADCAIAALSQIQTKINDAASARAAFGYKMNRLEKTISVLDIQRENMMASESRISDVDIATEMAELTRNQVLAQAGIAMLSQSMTIPQLALNLLR